MNQLRCPCQLQLSMCLNIIIGLWIYLIYFGFLNSSDNFSRYLRKPFFLFIPRQKILIYHSIALTGIFPFRWIYFARILLQCLIELFEWSTFCWEFIWNFCFCWGYWFWEVGVGDGAFCRRWLWGRGIIWGREWCIIGNVFVPYKVWRWI